MKKSDYFEKGDVEDKHMESKIWMWIEAMMLVAAVAVAIFLMIG